MARLASLQPTNLALNPKGKAPSAENGEGPGGSNVYEQCITKHLQL